MEASFIQQICVECLLGGFAWPREGIKEHDQTEPTSMLSTIYWADKQEKLLVTEGKKKKNHPKTLNVKA